MPWKKGESGNPGGRKKIDNPVRALAREHTELAVTTLVGLCRVSDYKVNLDAANSLLDRGWGKPVQSMEVDGNVTIEKIVREIIDHKPDG